MMQFNVRLARWYGGKLTLPRAERIAHLKAELAKVEAEASFLYAAIRAEEADAGYAERAKANKVRHREHLDSRYWQRLRGFKCISTNWKCEGCGEQHGLALELHHPTYDRLGHEELADVQALCRPCHEKAHGLVRVTITAPTPTPA
jgi:hypothetical protein